jgi:hypothetical protein
LVAVPTGHGSHTVRPGWDCAEPAEHGVHDTVPLPAVTVPGAHCEQACAPGVVMK